VLDHGSPGGRTIINTIAQRRAERDAWGLGGREAVDGARSHHRMAAGIDST
jgi:hypothetical protein